MFSYLCICGESLLSSKLESWIYPIIPRPKKKIIFQVPPKRNLNSIRTMGRVHVNSCCPTRCQALIYINFNSHCAKYCTFSRAVNDYMLIFLTCQSKKTAHDATTNLKTLNNTVYINTILEICHNWSILKKFKAYKVKEYKKRIQIK